MTETLFNEYVAALDGNLTPLRMHAVGPRLKGKSSTSKRQRICAVLTGDVQVNKKAAQQLADEMKENGFDRLILILSQPGSAPGIKLLQAAVTLETWTYAIAQSQFHRNRIVPVHQKLSQKQKQEFFSKYNLASSQMASHMQLSTAMAKFLGIRTGDVVRIHRVTNEGLSAAYRVGS